MLRVLWRIIERTGSQWEILDSEWLQPYDGFKRVATCYRDKRYESLLDAEYGYATIDTQGLLRRLPVSCPKCEKLTCEGCGGIELQHPAPPADMLCEYVPYESCEDVETPVDLLELPDGW